MLDEEKLRNLDKLSSEELAELTSQSSTIFVNDSFPFIFNLLGKPMCVLIFIATLIKMVNGIPVEVVEYSVALRSNYFPLLVVHFLNAARDRFQFQ